MTIAITSQGKDMESLIDPRFGRCRYFIFINEDSGDFEAVENSNLPASGAGVQTAQFLADKGVKAVITGNVGPNAVRGLQAAGIKIYITDSGKKVSEAFEMYKQGELKTISSATVNSHFGLR
ncbi:MAG: hypothetical protein PWQ82_545 [Thermosediminibacterales bacterium]|nr:hypothetical protein [Thermosediminibacterales bacterium]MDK2835959.1 hypothetical protein [Thermosediminibacterales bacterium]